MEFSLLQRIPLVQRKNHYRDVLIGIGASPFGVMYGHHGSVGECNVPELVPDSVASPRINGNGISFPACGQGDTKAVRRVPIFDAR